MAEFKKRGGFVAKRPGGFRKTTGDMTLKFPAACSSCGAQTMVPFRPDGIKPVYCRDCFRRGADASVPRGPRPVYSAPSPDASTRQLEMINSKLDTLIRMLKDSAR